MTESTIATPTRRPPPRAVLSQTAEYALRAVLHLAEVAAASDRPVNVTDMAHALGVPRNYLSKTLHQLSRAGVVTSTFGPGGGFRLARPANVLTLDEVVTPFDERGSGERHCLLGRARCVDSDPCQAHPHWKGISTQIQQFFRSTTVATLLLPEHADSPLLPPSRGSHGTPRRTRSRK